MKLTLRPLFRSKKSSSVSRSDPASYSTGPSSSDSSSSSKETPKSVLPCSTIPLKQKQLRDVSGEIASGDWSHLSSSDMRWDVVEVFKLFDKDGDGRITRNELQLVFRRLGVEPPTDEELVLMLEEADRDGDGCISLEEFSALSSDLGPVGGSELRDAFDYFDTNRDGKISAEELFRFFSTVEDDGCTLEDCRRMILGVDSDGDGFVCFEDFARMMECRG